MRAGQRTVYLAGPSWADAAFKARAVASGLGAACTQPGLTAQHIISTRQAAATAICASALACVTRVDTGPALQPGSWGAQGKRSSLCACVCVCVQIDAGEIEIPAA